MCAVFVQNLRRKAEQRNPDEFYFAMEGKATKGGLHSGRCVFVGHALRHLLLLLQPGVCYLPCKYQAPFVTCSITEANKYTQEELRFMKSQDASYMALKAQTELKVRLIAACLLAHQSMLQTASH